MCIPIELSLPYCAPKSSCPSSLATHQLICRHTGRCCRQTGAFHTVLTAWPWLWGGELEYKVNLMYTSSHVNTPAGGLCSIPSESAQTNAPLWSDVHSSSTKFSASSLWPTSSTAQVGSTCVMLNKWIVWATVPFQQGHDADYSDSPEYF